jgi:acyl dehydratase
MTEHYLEDHVVGQKFDSVRLGIDAARIKSFAAEFDPQPFHLNEEAAKRSILRGLAASGWHTAALTMRPSMRASSSRRAALSARAATY